jgi:hypothetical protein
MVVDAVVASVVVVVGLEVVTGFEELEFDDDGIVVVVEVVGVSVDSAGVAVVDDPIGFSRLPSMAPLSGRKLLNDTLWLGGISDN